MNRRDLLSTAISAGTGALVLGTEGGLRPALAGGGFQIYGLKGACHNSEIEKSSDETPWFQCDLFCEGNSSNIKLDTTEKKLGFYCTIQNCYVNYKRGKGHGKGEWKKVACQPKKIWLPCDFDTDQILLIIGIFILVDVEGHKWRCEPPSVYCGKPEINQVFIKLLIALFIKLHGNQDCSKEYIAFVQIFVTVLVTIYFTPPWKRHQA